MHLDHLVRIHTDTIDIEMAAARIINDILLVKKINRKDVSKVDEIKSEVFRSLERVYDALLEQEGIVAI